MLFLPLNVLTVTEIRGAKLDLKLNILKLPRMHKTNSHYSIDIQLPLVYIFERYSPVDNSETFELMNLA